jgi:hypothetical protein
MAQTRISKKALVELGLLEGHEEGCAETLGDAELADGVLEGPLDGSDEGLEAGRWLIRGTRRRPTSRTRLARRRGRGLCRNTMRHRARRWCPRRPGRCHIRSTRRRLTSRTRLARRRRRWLCQDMRRRRWRARRPGRWNRRMTRRRHFSS